MITFVKGDNADEALQEDEADMARSSISFCTTSILTTSRV